MALEQRFTILPVLHEGQERFEVIHADGRPTGIIRDTRQSANGVAQDMNRRAAYVIRNKGKKGMWL